MIHAGCGGKLKKGRAARGKGKFVCDTCQTIVDIGVVYTPSGEQREAGQRTPSLDVYDARRPRGAVRYGPKSKRY